MLLWIADAYNKAQENNDTMPSIIPGMWNAAVIIPDTGSRFAIFKQKVEDELKTKITHKKLVAQIVDTPTLENPQILTDEQKKEGLAIVTFTRRQSSSK